MVTETTIKLIIGIVFIVFGLFLSFNNKNVSKGAARFYQALYTEKNLKIIFKIVGIILVIMGLVLILIN